MSGKRERRTNHGVFNPTLDAPTSSPEDNILFIRLYICESSGSKQGVLELFHFEQKKRVSGRKKQAVNMKAHKRE